MRQNWDLYQRMKTDREFQQLLSRLGACVSVLERDPRGGRNLARSMNKLLEACNYNLGMLFPYMFPAYIIDRDNKRQPLSLLNRPFGFSMTSVVPGSKTVVRAGRQAAKSTTLAALKLVVAHVLGKRMMYLAPHNKQLETFARKVMELERYCRIKVSSVEFKQNQYYKEYPSGAVFDLVYAYTSAEQTRGKTTDWLSIDEAQSFDGGLWPEVQQVMKASNWPVFLVAGTSLTIDTFLESNYQNGSRGTWHIRCPGRTKTGAPRYLDCGNQKQIMAAIQQKGLCCPWTGVRLDPRSGFFVHEMQGRFEQYNTSLHVPQIIIPDFTIDPVKWKEIWDAYNEYDTPKFLQEVMGIPTEQGARELTEQELISICTLGTQDVVQKKAKTQGYYKYIVSGCDWGGSDYNRATHTKESYTVHVMLGITNDGKFDIIHMRRYSGMGYREIVGHILADHRRLGGNALASDFGAGAAYNMLLRESSALSASRHIIFNYVGPNSAAVAEPHGDHMFNQLSLNRNEAITKLFMAVKESRIRCYEWEEAKTLLSYFLNMTRTQSENSATGSTTFRYLRSGEQPDDTLHATNFAFVLGKIMLGEQLVPDQGLQRELQNKLTHFDSPIQHVPDPYMG